MGNGLLPLPATQPGTEPEAGVTPQSVICRGLHILSHREKILLGLTPTSTAILFGYTRSVPERLRQRGVNELAQDSKPRRWDSNPGPLDLDLRSYPLGHRAPLSNKPLGLRL